MLTLTACFGHVHGREYPGDRLDRVQRVKMFVEVRTTSFEQTLVSLSSTRDTKLRAYHVHNT